MSGSRENFNGWKEGFAVAIISLVVMAVLFGGIYLSERWLQPGKHDCHSDCAELGYRTSTWVGDQCRCFDLGTPP